MKLAGAQRICLCQTGNTVYPQIRNKNLDLNFLLLQRPSGGQLGIAYASDDVHTLQRGFTDKHSTAAELLQPLLHSFWESRAEICSPGSSEEDGGNISEPAISTHCPCTHTYELKPAVFQNYLFFYFKICTSTEAKILLAVIRRIRKGRGLGFASRLVLAYMMLG